MSGSRRSARRERHARLLGVAVAAGAMTVALLTIGWPAPAVSAGLGLIAYGLARGSSGRTGDAA